jgi:hypothetical protein
MFSLSVAVPLISEDRTAKAREGIPGKGIKVQFTFTGFSQDTGFRVFAFEGTAADRTRTECKVRADLALIRIYGIRVQELPLLCRGLLERLGEVGQSCTVTFTEEEMRLHAHGCAEARNAALQKRKTVRRPPTNHAGSGWRGPQRS